MSLPQVPENLENFPKLQEYLVALVAAIANGSISFTGNLDLGGNKIVNLSDPINDTDAANKDYVDDLEALDLRLDGSRPMTGDLDMGTATGNDHHIHFVADPVNPQDAATKHYVDNSIGSTVGLVKKATKKNTSGNFGSGGLAVVPGGQVSFTLANPGDIVVILCGYTTSGNTFGHTAGYSLDSGPTVAIDNFTQVVGAGADFIANQPLNATAVITGLSAGSHTIDMAFASPQSTLLANSTTPAFTVVLYDA